MEDLKTLDDLLNGSVDPKIAIYSLHPLKLGIHSVGEAEGRCLQWNLQVDQETAFALRAELISLIEENYRACEKMFGNAELQIDGFPCSDLPF